MPTTGIEMFTCIPILEEKIEKLERENKQLKIQISAREEEYRKLEQNWNTLFQWLIEQEEKAWDEVSSTFSTVLNKMKELERGVSDVED